MSASWIGDKPAKLDGIQLLRGLAALLVVFGHANLMMRYPQYFGESPYQARDLGGFGVAVFFVISGFIIVTSTLGDRLAPRLDGREYARRRFIRILPFMWICVLGYNLFTYIGTGMVEWLPMMRAMVVWPVGELKPNVLWSLRHEFLFYLIFGLTMVTGRASRWLLVAWFVAPLVIYGIMPFDGPEAWHPYHNELFRVVFLGSEGGANVQFGIGFLLGIVWLGGATVLHPLQRPGFAACVVAIVAGAVIALAWPAGPGLAKTLLWSVLAGLIVYVGIVAKASPGRVRDLGVLLGDASFSIYLTHNPVLLTLLELNRGHQHLLPPTMWMILFAGIATMVGIAVHFLVERPLIAALSGNRPLVAWLLPRRSAQL